MDRLLSKLNYKGDKRICILNGDKKYIKTLSKLMVDTRIDLEIDRKFLYNYIIVFADKQQNVEDSCNKVLHNLFEDGILWYFYPKTPLEDSNDPLTRKKGWNACKDAGFDAVRHICIDDQLSATRFRNKKFISRKSKD